MLSVMDPRFLVTITSKGIKKLRPWVVKHMGHVAGANKGAITEHKFSLGIWLERLSDRTLLLLFSVPLVSIVLVGFGFLTKNACSDGLRVCMALSACSYVVFFSALFGDGFVGFSKHTHLIFSIYLGLTIIVSVGMLKGCFRLLEMVAYSVISSSILRGKDVPDGLTIQPPAK